MRNQITLDYLLAEQGVLGNTSCCVYINDSGKVKTELEKNHAKAGWSASVNPQSRSHSFFHLPSWLSPDTWGFWLSAILQGSLTSSEGPVSGPDHLLSQVGRLCEALRGMNHTEHPSASCSARPVVPLGVMCFVWFFS